MVVEVRGVPRREDSVSGDVVSEGETVSAACRGESWQFGSLRGE